MWKNNVFSSRICKKGLQVCIGKCKRPSEQVCIWWGKYCYNRCPLMCEVRGVSVMAEIYYNSQKWSNGDPVGWTSFSWEYYMLRTKYQYSIEKPQKKYSTPWKEIILDNKPLRGGNLLLSHLNVQVQDDSKWKCLLGIHKRLGGTITTNGPKLT